jgi:hypothetical protein
VCPQIVGENIYIAERRATGGMKSQQNHTIILSTVLDKLFEYLSQLSGITASSTLHRDLKLRKIMDLLGE